MVAKFLQAQYAPLSPAYQCMPVVYLQPRSKIGSRLSAKSVVVAVITSAPQGQSWMHGGTPSEGEGGRGWLACHLSLCMCAALCSCKISARGGRWAAVSCRLEGSPGRRQEAGAGGANHFMSASLLLRFSTSFQLTGTADPPPTPDQTLTIFCPANLQAGRN